MKVFLLLPLFFFFPQPQTLAFADEEVGTLTAEEQLIAEGYSEEERRLYLEHNIDVRASAPFSVRISNAAIRLLASSVGLSVGQQLASMPGVEALSDELVRSSEFWDRHVVFGLVGGIPSGVLGFFNKELQIFFAKDRLVRPVVDKVIDNRVTRAFVPEPIRVGLLDASAAASPQIEGVMRSAFVDGLVLVWVLGGLVVMEYDQFSSISAFIAGVASLTWQSYGAQGYLEPSVADQTIRAKKNSPRRARFYQGVSDTFATALSCVTQCAVIMTKMGSPVGGQVIVWLTRLGKTNMGLNIVRRFFLARKERRETDAPTKGSIKAGGCGKSFTPGS